MKRVMLCCIIAWHFGAKGVRMTPWLWLRPRRIPPLYGVVPVGGAAGATGCTGAGVTGTRCGLSVDLSGVTGARGSSCGAAVAAASASAAATSAGDGAADSSEETTIDSSRTIVFLRVPFLPFLRFAWRSS